VACSSAKEDERSLTAEELYKQGYERLEKTSYAKAAEDFDKVETEHPYSKWAVQAKLMSAYAYYKDEKYDDAVLSLERFIKYHPANKDIPYAYYMKGLCYYDRISPAQKDQENTKQAQNEFARLIAYFPETDYAKDAQKKMNLIDDHLAGQEMTVGRYYLKQKNYLSALNRFDTVVRQYQTTPQIEEALYRQVEIYSILGLRDLAVKAAAVLKHNYPNGHWTEKALPLIATKD
jgi:outer membrane protein assembly factor BamD